MHFYGETALFEVGVKKPASMLAVIRERQCNIHDKTKLGSLL